MLRRPAIRICLKYRYFVVSIILVLWCAVYFQRLTISVLLMDPGFIADLKLAGHTELQGLLMSIFLLAYAFSNLLAAPLGDHIGPRKAMLIGIAIAFIALLMSGFARLFLIMLLARFVLGIGQGIHFPTQSIFVNNWFPPLERGLANGVYGMGGCIGPLLAIPLLSNMVLNYRWEWLFFFVALLTLVFSLPVILGMVSDSPRENKYTSQEERDYIALNSSTANMSIKGTLTNNYVYILKVPGFLLLSLSYIAYLSMWWGLMTWLPSFLIESCGYTVKSAGWVAALPYAIAIFSMMAGGYYSDRKNKRAIFCCIGLAGATLSIFLMSLTTSKVFCAVLMSGAVALTQFYYAPFWAMLQSLLPDELVGTGSGLISGMSNLVSAAAPFLIGLLIHITNTYSAGLMYLAVLGLLGALSNLALVYRGY